MEKLIPAHSGYFCAICGKPKAAFETWFLITEGLWKDRLEVWKLWQDDAGSAAGGTGFALCSPKHVRELVVHWMTTGCLDYPFATTQHTGTQPGFSSLGGCHLGRMPSCFRLCELAVHREGILRALRNNPLSLNTILDEMMFVLEGEVTEEAEDALGSEASFEIPGI